MTKDEQNFENYVDSLRFDDEPSKDHQDKLEKQLLQVYDHEQKYGDYVEPVTVYFRKLAIAASFLVVCGVLFWAIDTHFIRSAPPYAADPEIMKIIEQQPASAQEQKQLMARVNEIWTMISDQDSEALVSVLQADDLGRKVRAWAAKYLGQFGNEKTLTSLEQVIHEMEITDPANPLIVAEQAIRDRLERSQSEPNQ